MTKTEDSFLSSPNFKNIQKKSFLWRVGKAVDLLNDLQNDSYMGNMTKDIGKAKEILMKVVETYKA